VVARIERDQIVKHRLVEIGLGDWYLGCLTISLGIGTRKIILVDSHFIHMLGGLRLKSLQ